MKNLWKKIMALMFGCVLLGSLLSQVCAVAGTPNTFPVNQIKETDSSTTAEELIDHLITFLIAVVGITAVAGIMVGGIILMTAYGSESKIQIGKKVILFAVLGLVFTFLAYLIVSFIMTILYSVENYG